MSCRMKTRRRIGGGLAVGLLAAAISHGATAKDLKTISMIYFNGSSESVEVGLMVDEGILERNGLKPEFAKATSGPAITSALPAGRCSPPGYPAPICALANRALWSPPSSQHPLYNVIAQKISTLLIPASA